METISRLGDAEGSREDSVAAVVTSRIEVPAAGVESGLPARDQQSAINIVVDAEAFGRVFATVLAELLDERVPMWGTATSNRLATAPVAAPTRVKRSCWAQAGHLDVLLIGLATVIVLVVLAAWLA